MAKVQIPAAEGSNDIIRQMKDRYQDLTSTEMIGIEAFHRLSLAKEFHEASRSLEVSLDLEHFIATMPLDPAQFTPEMLDEVRELRSQTEKITGQFCRLNCLNELVGEGNRAQVAAITSNLASALASASA
jgi:hypothetical protein